MSTSVSKRGNVTSTYTRIIEEEKTFWIEPRVPSMLLIRYENTRDYQSNQDHNFSTSISVNIIPRNFYQQNSVSSQLELIFLNLHFGVKEYPICQCNPLK
jgi:hypothetical protein